MKKYSWWRVLTTVSCTFGGLAIGFGLAEHTYDRGWAVVHLVMFAGVALMNGIDGK